MAKATRSTEGYVYFLEAKGIKRVKIGFTTSPKTRLNELRLGSPVPLTILKVVRGNLSLEIAVLALFHKYRLHGEWFDSHDKLMRFIKSLCEDKYYSPEELLIK